MNFVNPGFNNLIFAPGINSAFPQHPGFTTTGFGNPGFGFGASNPGFGGFGDANPGFGGGGVGHPGLGNNPLPIHLLMDGIPPIPMF